VCPALRSRLSRLSGSAALPCDVTIPAPRSVPLIGANLPTQVISCRSRTRRYAMIANAPRRGARPPLPRLENPDSGHADTTSITVRVRGASRNAMKPRIQCVVESRFHCVRQRAERSGTPVPWSGPAPARCCAESSGHFRLSGRSWERGRPVSEAGISNTTVESSSGAVAFPGAGGSAAAVAPAAAVVLVATVASSGIPPSDHGTAGSHGGLPLAAGLAAGSAVGSATRSALGTAACPAACAASRSRLRSRPRTLPPAGAGAGTGSAT
jgi:hypothetical protein